VDLRSLKYFVKAAETLNFTRTAKECYISQTAISLNIARMEQEIGYDLFDRGGHGVHLTSAGEDFYIWANITLKSYENAIKRGIDINGGYSGTIRLAFSNSIEAKTFVRDLQVFRKKNPGVYVDVYIINPHHIVGEIASGNVDAVIAVPYDFYNDNKFVVKDLFESPFGLAMAVSHPMADFETIDPVTVKDETALVLAGKGMPESANAMYEQWREVGIEPHDLKRVCRIEEIFLSLQISDNIAVVPSFYWTDDKSFLSDGITLRPFATDEPPAMKWGFVTLRGNNNPKLNRLFDVLREKDYNSCIIPELNI
jgi:DNA-binding transcriptional LysR family regulator